MIRYRISSFSSIFTYYLCLQHKKKHGRALLVIVVLLLFFFFLVVDCINQGYSYYLVSSYVLHVTDQSKLIFISSHGLLAIVCLLVCIGDTHNQCSVSCELLSGVS